MRTFYGNALDKIMAGDRVTIVSPQGALLTGKAVMTGPAGWVLNLGGRYGTPGIASMKNIMLVKRAGQTVLASHAMVKSNLHL